MSLHFEEQKKLVVLVELVVLVGLVVLVKIVLPELLQQKKGNINVRFVGLVVLEVLHQKKGNINVLFVGLVMLVKIVELEEPVGSLQLKYWDYMSQS